MDWQPKHLTWQQIEQLELLSRSIVNGLELQRKAESARLSADTIITRNITTQMQTQKQLEEITNALNQTAIVAITDVQGTITFVIGLATVERRLTLRDRNIPTSS